MMSRLVSQGDLAPSTLLRTFNVPNFHAQAAATIARPPIPPTPPVPPTPGVPHPGRSRTASIIPWARGFKIADNQSPRPQDRFFFTFNYFNNLNADLNRRLGGTFHNENIYRELFGFEKTFLDGNASVGVRVPLNTISADSSVRGLGGTFTSAGNLSFFTKYVLWKSDENFSNLVSTGLAVTVPNGPTAFAGAPYSGGFRDVQIQPFVGYFFSRDRWYFQGFEAVDVPTDARDVTMLYNDLGIGYFAYRNVDPRGWLRAIAPTFETHINVPLNHAGSFVATDRAATPNVVDLTFGINVFLGERSVLSLAYIRPVTGPLPFNGEFALLFNYNFGRTRRPPPPVIGQ